MTGIPSWSEILLNEIVRHNKVDTIHDIWPNLQVYSTGGVAFGPYRKSFESLFAKPMTYIDTYLASEGYLATQKRPDTNAMALITNNGVFFEFVPFTPENMDDHGRVQQYAQALTIEDAEENVEYVLLISTVAGAWRYMIGDTVIITDKERAEIIISGRTKHFLNVVGEQLSVHQMNQAIEKLQVQLGLDIQEFTVASVRRNEQYINKWYLGVSHIRDGSAEVTQVLDRALQESSKGYTVARRQTLDAVEVEIIPVTHFYKWSKHHNQLGGQTKIPRVMNADDFEAFETFITKL